MTFKVDIQEVTGMAEKIKTTSNVLENDLLNVTRQLDDLIALDSFQGEAATRAKKYFGTVHQTAIQSIQLITNQIASNIQMHIDTFHEDVDSSENAKIEYNYLQEIKEDIQVRHADIVDSVQNITDTINEVSDIIPLEPPSLNNIQTSKNDLDQTIDQLTNIMELFTEKGTEQDDEIKEMLHHLETLIAEASVKADETRFNSVELSDVLKTLNLLSKTNQTLASQQEEKRKSETLERGQGTFGKVPKMMESLTPAVKYEKKPSTIVEISQVFLDVVKGTGTAVYHLVEDFFVGTLQLLEDVPGTLEALGSMIAHPIDTGKYISKAIIDSFNRDVINGDAESRAHWFVYAAGTVFGFKGLGKAGKAGTQAAKKGAQGVGNKLDELLPYHPKHQLAVDGPVPYNVYDGNFLKEQLLVRFSKQLTSKKKSLHNLTKRQLATKPKHSPSPDKWIKKGGKIKVDDKGVWTYTNKKGQSISYPNGFPDFSEYVHPRVEPVKIKVNQPKSHSKDYRRANEKAGLGRSTDPPITSPSKPPEGYTWHHYQDGETMILVEEKIHQEFTHIGGASLAQLK